MIPPRTVTSVQLKLSASDFDFIRGCVKHEYDLGMDLVNDPVVKAEDKNIARRDATRAFLLLREWGVEVRRP